MKAELAEQILAARVERRPVVLVTWLASGQQRLVSPVDTAGLGDLAAIVADAFRLDRSGTHATDEGEAFIRVFNPPLRLIVIGAVHAAQSLLPLARLAGFQVTIIDPRTAFASPERFPDVEVRAEWPDDALPGLAIDRRTAFVALTHDPKIDDPALAIALRAEPFYIGALGSTRTHAGRIERLKAFGFAETDLARIHAPIGLNIGAQGPAEIAISIVAEIIAVLRGVKDRLQV
jgi:xanthine dehydrogenase accessory factor